MTAETRFFSTAVCSAITAINYVLVSGFFGSRATVLFTAALGAAFFTNTFLSDIVLAAFFAMLNILRL